ncbi:cysteine methyltransferase [Solibacillus sp. FSL R5-0691]|uniref:cysteine methyltransferase n=1 Tax=unclassified Solibacillus TaxID=2637870 RepID=UPI0030CD74B2
MNNSQKNQTMLYLASDELMQTHLSCTKISNRNKDEFTFSIRVFCYVEKNNSYAKSVPLYLILGLNKQGVGMTLAVDLVNIPNVCPMQLKKIVEHLQKSPALLLVVCQQLDKIASSSSIEEAVQAKLAKHFFIENAPKGITSFTTNRQANELYWLMHKNQIISDMDSFKLDSEGGHIAFTVQVGFKHDFIMQCYEVDCMMHMFNEDEKLGYYFELYLDQENYHHQLLYETLPDQFMDNKTFLNQVLEEMKKRNEEQYDDYLQDLIEKFTASI